MWIVDFFHCNVSSLLSRWTFYRDTASLSSVQMSKTFDNVNTVDHLLKAKYLNAKILRYFTNKRRKFSTTFAHPPPPPPSRSASKLWFLLPFSQFPTVSKILEQKYQKMRYYTGEGKVINNGISEKPYKKVTHCRLQLRKKPDFINFWAGQWPLHSSISGHDIQCNNSCFFLLLLLVNVNWNKSTLFKFAS